MTGYEQTQGRPCHCGCYVLKDEIGAEATLKWVRAAATEADDDLTGLILFDRIGSMNLRRVLRLDGEQ